MIDVGAIASFHRAQAALLASTYDRAWKHGVASYQPDADPEEPEQPQADETQIQLAPVIASGTVAALIARRERPYQPPLLPFPEHRDRALAPALLGLDRMAGELPTIIPTLEQRQAAEDAIRAGTIEGEDAINYALALAAREWVDSNEWRLTAGESVAWAGEQDGYAQAANEDGQLLEWLPEGDDRVCFPAGTLVETEAGPRPIEQVQVGDRVLTHAGRYRPVLRQMRRTFGAPLIELTTITGRRLRATPNHPVLVRQQGQLRWCRADEIRERDVVLLKHREDLAGLHFGHADRRVPVLSEIGIAPSIFRRIAMPVEAVDLDHEMFREEEIHRVGTYSHLAGEGDMSVDECQSGNALGRCLALVAAPARAVAEAVATGGARHGAEGSSAVGAGHMHGRAVALLRAMTALISAVHGKALAASGAVPIGRPSAGTFNGADRVALRARGIHAELLAAAGAAFDDLRHRRTTLPRAESVRSTCPECLTASLACLGLLGRTRAAARMGMLTLPVAVASRGAEPLRRVREEQRKGLATLLAGVHRRLLALTRTTPTAYTGTVAASRLLLAREPDAAGLADAIHVYNLEVETDHTYIANGFVVHNCNDCDELGDMPPMPLEDWPTTPGGSQTECQVGCRCVMQVSDMQLELGDQLPALSEAQEATVDRIAEGRSEQLEPALA